MSYGYPRHFGAVLGASCVVLVGASALTAVAIARAEETATSSSVRRLSRERSAFRLAKYVNKSTWAADEKTIGGVVFDAVVKNSHAELDSVQATVQDTTEAGVKQIAVTAFEKDAFRVTRKRLLVAPSVAADLLRVEPDHQGDCLELCMDNHVQMSNCPDSEDGPFDAVFATPYSKRDNEVAPKAAVSALKTAAGSLETLQHLKVRLLFGEDATIANYVGWLRCDTIRYFGSIAPVDTDTGNIALANGEYMPADWFRAFARNNISLTGKVLFMNSDNAFLNGAQGARVRDPLVRTFIAPGDALVPSSAGEVFACFWRDSMTRSRGFRYPRMIDALNMCQAPYWNPGIYLIDGDQGPMLPSLEIDETRLPRPSLVPILGAGRDPRPAPENASTPNQ